MSDTTLHYHWDVRPGYEPLTRKEVALALKIADYDAEQAASILKVDTSRLMGWLRGHSDLLRQVSLRAVFPFISIRDSDEGIKITIKPDRSYNHFTANRENDGSATIMLNKVSDNASHLLRVAQAVRDENK